MLGRGFFLVPLLFLGLVAGGIVAGVVSHHYYDDDDRGPRVVQVTKAPDGTTTPQVIEIYDRGWRGHGGGFFPGFFLFPLLFFGLIWLIAGSFWRRGGGRGGPGGWGGPGGRAAYFEEWHRQQHAGDVPTPPPAASA